jgi:hypothetical protein
MQNTYPNQEEYKMPWLSTNLIGLEGSHPIIISILDISPKDKISLEDFRKYVKVRGNGIFEVDYEHKIPKGKYNISLNFKNEGHSKNLNKIFKIIVE